MEHFHHVEKGKSKSRDYINSSSVAVYICLMSSGFLVAPPRTAFYIQGHQMNISMYLDFFSKNVNYLFLF